LLTGPNAAAHHVYLNLTPGQLTVTDVLRVLVDTIPIEAARIMVPDDGKEAEILADFRLLLPDTPLQPLDRRPADPTWHWRSRPVSSACTPTFS
jgi:hypothetical protein